jgi:hypothetical protein
MSESVPLYNSRVTKIYLLYLEKNYPDVSVDSILDELGVARYQIEDPAHWFTQEQQDQLHDILVKRTGNPNIAREAGRFSTSSEGLGATMQYALGLMSPTAIYLLSKKMNAMFSRGADVNARKIGNNQVEITANPNPGVKEKPYQCENRSGYFESIAHVFTDQYAQIDHPSCIHRGDDICRYIITWSQTLKFQWKLVRNYLFIGCLLALIVLFFVLPLPSWGILVMACTLLNVLVSYYTVHLDNKVLTRTIESQKEAAQDSLLESNILYNNALMAQEIGQATSSILDIDRLLRTVSGVMEKRLEFDRGMIMLVDKKSATLRYAAGYGQSAQVEAIFQKTRFHLDNPESKGVFVLAIREKRPFLIDNLLDIQDSFSPRSFELAKKIGSESLICVPIIYEEESLGILAVDNSKSSRPLRQSDMSTKVIIVIWWKTLVV